MARCQGSRIAEEGYNRTHAKSRYSMDLGALLRAGPAPAALGRHLERTDSGFSMRMRSVGDGYQLIYSEPSDVDRWMEKWVNRLNKYGPRFARDLKGAQVERAIYRGEKFGLFQPHVADGKKVWVAGVTDYKAWDAARRARGRKKTVPHRGLKPATVMQLMVRGMVVEHLEKKDGYGLQEHIRPEHSRLEDPTGQIVHILLKYDGYRSRTLTEALVRDFSALRFTKHRIIVYHPRPAQVTPAVQNWSPLPAEVRNLHEIVPRELTRSV